MESLLGEDGGAAFDLQCPHCNWAMSKVDVAGVTLDRCGQCGGIWLDRNELKFATDKDPKALAEVDQSYGSDAEGFHKPRQCPRDKSRLVTMADVRQSHVEFESCTVCGGIFLDAGELGDLSEFTLRERLQSFLG